MAWKPAEVRTTKKALKKFWVEYYKPESIDISPIINQPQAEEPNPQASLAAFVRRHQVSQITEYEHYIQQETTVDQDSLQ